MQKRRTRARVPARKIQYEFEVKAGSLLDVALIHLRRGASWGDQSKIDETAFPRARDSKFDVQRREPPKYLDNGASGDRRARIEGDALTTFA